MTDEPIPELPIPEITELNRIYFEGAARGELRVRRCMACEALFRFAYEWCPRCWSTEIGWQRATGFGRVTHFSIVHVGPSEAFETPYVLALIELDEGVRMMSNVLCDPQAVRIGMPVRVTFEERRGVFLPMFVPDR